MAGMLEFASNWMGEVGSVAVRFSSARLVTETSAFAGGDFENPVPTQRLEKAPRHLSTATFFIK